MELVPTQEDVVGLLRQTGALRDGHFEYPNGLHSNEYLQVALAMRYYQHAKVLSVGLSRRLRANSEIRAIIPELSIVAPATGGLPVAYGVCEALRAHQVYWAEQEDTMLIGYLRQFLFFDFSFFARLAEPGTQHNDNFCAYICQDLERLAYKSRWNSNQRQLRRDRQIFDRWVSAYTLDHLTLGIHD